MVLIPLPRPTRLMALCATLIATALLPLGADARCTGQNLLAEMSAAEEAAVGAATEAQPFARGNLWQAQKPGQNGITLLGTYHMADPRHDALVARITPLMQQATTLLVEAGPEEERALKRDIAADPSLLFLTEGASLMEQLPPEEWEQISAAMAARNIPAFMGAKMRPWYLATMLAIAPCDMAEVAAGKGLDHRVMDLAEAKGLPIRALEPHTTLFGIFETLTPEQQLDMLRSSLLMEDRIADYANTLAEGYFTENSRRIWEYLRIMAHSFPGYSPEKADAEFAMMEEVLMARRNRAWIPVIEEAAAQGPTFVAFGALHLAGEDGVLNLLAKDGWQITRLPIAP